MLVLHWHNIATMSHLQVGTTLSTNIYKTFIPTKLTISIDPTARRCNNVVATFLCLVGYVRAEFCPINVLCISVLDFGIWGDLEKIVWENNLAGIESFKDFAKELDACHQVNNDNTINSFKKQL